LDSLQDIGFQKLQSNCANLGHNIANWLWESLQSGISAYYLNDFSSFRQKIIPNRPATCLCLGRLTSNQTLDQKGAFMALSISVLQNMISCDLTKVTG
jgi:hypothetical protein